LGASRSLLEQFSPKEYFFVRVKQDENQLQQGREALGLLAKAFEEDWSEEQIERALHQI
jgi:hypothetical protein